MVGVSPDPGSAVFAAGEKPQRRGVAPLDRIDSIEMRVVFENPLRALWTVHLVDADVVVDRADAEEDASRRERGADHLSLSGTDFFVETSRRFFKGRVADVVVSVLPEGDAAIAGQRRQVVSVVVEGHGTEVDGGDGAGVAAEDSDWLAVVEVPDANDFVARTGGQQPVVVRQRLEDKKTITCKSQPNITKRT